MALSHCRKLQSQKNTILDLMLDVFEWTNIFLQLEQSFEESGVGSVSF